MGAAESPSWGQQDSWTRIVFSQDVSRRGVRTSKPVQFRKSQDWDRTGDRKPRGSVWGPVNREPKIKASIKPMARPCYWLKASTSWVLGKICGLLIPSLQIIAKPTKQKPVLRRWPVGTSPVLPQLGPSTFTATGLLPGRGTKNLQASRHSKKKKDGHLDFRGPSLMLSVKTSWLQVILRSNLTRLYWSGKLSYHNNLPSF